MDWVDGVKTVDCVDAVEGAAERIRYPQPHTPALTPTTMDNAKHERQAFLKWFLHWEAAGSVVLLAATIVALAWANSPWADAYHHLEKTPAGVSWGDASFTLSVGHWVADGLMAIFFFVVGLEIKRELVVGSLSSLRRAVLPVCAALGGMIVPALIYAVINWNGEGLHGWGIPMATDIAFALGIMALLGDRIPIGLKVFLTALAIADDLGAVTVIALFYSEQIVLAGLVYAGIGLGLIRVAAYFRIRHMWVYQLLMVGVWAAVYASGIHATVAGVFLAMLVPVKPSLKAERFFAIAQSRLEQLQREALTEESVLDRQEQRHALGELALAAEAMQPAGMKLEHRLHSIQSFLILPLFALFSAGITIDRSMLDHFPSAVSVGIVAGLVFGKPIGIGLASWIAVRVGWSDLPEGVTWKHLLAAGMLAGVGFTMSIFVSNLAFKEPSMVDDAKLAVLIASLVAGVAGYLVLHRMPRRTDAPTGA